MLLWNLLLALTWCALRGEISLVNLVVGFLLGYAVLWMARPVVGPTRYHARVPKVAAFILYFLWQLVVANLRLARHVLTPREKITPGVVAVPLDARTDAEIVMLANLITLTPGTLSLDVSTDRRILYIHGVDLADPEGFRREIKDGLERRLLEVLR